MDLAVGQDSRRAAPRTERLGLLRLLGPAFVASVAYVDPGNVAANVSAGAQFGFLLVWVLVGANAMAVVVQYLSAKLGIVTGRSLPEVLGQRFTRPARLAYWGQAELVAAATDLAEVIGGAIALNLLFDLPLVLGGVITGVVSLALLVLQHRRRQRHFEFVITGLLVVLTVGFTAGLFVTPPPWAQAAAGLVPRFDGPQSVLLAASMLGATVMPHVIYLHSSLARDRHGRSRTDLETAHLLRATRWDVVIALAIAGGVNIAMLLLAATNLAGRDGTDTISGAHTAIAAALGPTIAVLFAVGLLASGLASTSVGAYAGAEIMRGLLRTRIPLLVRRLVTLTPALLLLATDVPPTSMLVISQVVLSFGIPFALIPLVLVTRDAGMMGARRNGALLHLSACAIAAVIVVLNITLLTLTIVG
ncbi:MULTISPECIES: Nramp family divalent metal transporter [Cellulosimicrobium]|uniref:Nramp family divalent metal transporter n=1 Tax=Cellulosimicrobium TaxID=157920 RepID=UPI001BAC2185|nr:MULTISPECIES: Nramp family divalent metal transporter [Cellulosimicrobium]QUC01901.1 Nramp family divalent metal transporter [Cellulosimicrobium cellulans]